MPTSQNGWSAAPNLATRPFVVNGVAFLPGIRDDDDVETVLRYVVEQYAARVEPLRAPGCWGFSYRENRNDPNSLSNHSSATAVDVNAPAHPNGVPTRQTFTPAQIAEVHQILAEVDHVVRWGGDYTGTPDAMHFEINDTPAAVSAVADRLRGDIDMDENTLRKIIREEATAAAKQAVKDLLATELGNGATVQNNLRKAGDTKAIAAELAAAVRKGVDAGLRGGR